MSSAVHLRRWFVFVALALGFFAAALSNEVYNITSPATLTWHIALRKLYSIVAFAIVGAAWSHASRSSVRASSVVIAAYSGAIEFAQHFTYGHEPFFFNVVDVVCGAIGGAAGPLIPWARVTRAAEISVRRMRRRRPRV